MSDLIRGSVMVVDDETALMKVLVETLAREGYAVRGFPAPALALEALRLEGCDVLLTDLMMPAMDGIALLQAAKIIDPNLVGIVMTGQGTVQTAVEAMKSGAYDYVLKPFKLAAMLPVLDRAIALVRLRSENLQLRETAAIHALSQAVALTLDRPGILAKTMAAVTQQTEGDEVSILLLTSAGDELEVVAAQGAGRAALVGERVALGQDIAGWVAQNREPLILNGSVRDSRFAPHSPRADIHSAISIPMLAGGALVGVLSVNSLHAGHVFSASQLKALEIVANTAAAALRNADLLEASQASERRFRALVEHSADGVVMTGADGLFKYVSPSSQRLLGYASAEAVGTDAAGYIHPDDLPGVMALLAALSQQPGRVATARYRFRHQNGAWRWLDASINNLLAEPAVQAFVFNYRDVTAAREAEERVHFQANLLDRIGQAVIATDLDGRITFWNQQAEALYGWTSADALGRNAGEIIPSQASQEQGAAIMRLLRLGQSWEGEFIVQRRDGATFPAQVTDSPVHDDQGALIGIIGVSTDISARKQAEAAITRTNDLLTQAEQLGHIGGWETEIASGREVWSDGIFRILGLEPGAYPAALDNYLEHVHPDDRERVLRADQAAGRAQAPLELEYRIVRPDGQVRSVYSRSETRLGVDGERARRLGVNMDITERKQAEAAMARTNELLSGAERVGNIGSWELDVASGREVWSEGLCRILGVPWHAADNTFAEYLERVHPDDRQRILAAALSTDHNLAPLEVEYRIVRPDGEVRDIYSRSETRLGANGQRERRLGVNMDITERKQAEAALARTNDLLSRAEQLGHIGSWWRHIATGEVIWSDGMYGLLGLAPAEIAPSFANFLQRVHPDDRVAAQQLVDNAYRGLPGLNVECRIILPDGQIRALDTRAAVIRDAQGEAAQLVGVSIDITERKQADAAMAESEDKFKYIFENSMIGKSITFLSGGLRVNRAFAAMLGYAIDELDSRTFQQVTHPDDLELSQAAVASLLSGEQQAVQITKRYLHKSGATVWADVTISLRRDQASQPLYFITSALDITERRQHERELEAIAAVSSALRAATTPVKMLPIILEQVTALLEASAASIVLRDPATGDSVVAAGWGNLAAMVGQRMPAGAGIVGHVIATGQPYLTSDIHTDPYLLDGAGADQMPAAVCAPLVTDTDTLGVLSVGRSNAFAGGELRVLSAIADIAASALQRARLHEQTEQQLRRLSALREIDDAIIGSLDLRVTLSIILPAVTSQLGVSAADVLLLNRGDHMLEYAAGHGFLTSAIQKSRLRQGQGYPGEALVDRKVVSIVDLKAQGDQFLRAGLLAGEGFKAYICAPLVAKGQIVGVLELFHRGPLNPNSEWLDFLQILAGQTAIAVADARQFVDLQRSNDDMVLAYDTTLEGWSAALDLRDKETEGHSQRVTEITLELAQAMGVAESELEHIRRGSLLHDIGKMGVPDAILFKPAKLTDDEWVIMRKHPVYAFQLLSPISFLRQALDIPYCHHEKWDGTGYPRQLKGEAIPLAARIFAVVDVWDALRSDRPYRASWTAEHVREHIRSLSGTHFDPRVVTAFLALHLAESLELELA